MQALKVAVLVLAFAAAASALAGKPKLAAALVEADAEVTAVTLTALQLQQIMVGTVCKPNCALSAIPASRATSYVGYLNAAMAEFGITSCADVAAFLGNVAQESNNLLYMKELGTGKEYEGRKDLGNTQKGDGVKYKGRGPIQTTGRNNYKITGDALKLDLINHPELLEQPANGFRASAFFWKNKGLNGVAGASETSFQATVRAVNGAIVKTTQYNNRKTIWTKAKTVLKC